MKLKSFSGQRYGRLVIEGDAGWHLYPSGFRKRLVRCRCNCGKEATCYLAALRSGNTRSCGCLERRNLAEIISKRVVHGDAVRNRQASEYRTWKSIIQRCTNPKQQNWEFYGGRGIAVCAEWRHDYAAFLAHIGRRPTPTHSIDRYPDNDGHYEPGNVRWATPKEQRANQRSAHA